jgi:hypothetical protein
VPFELTICRNVSWRWNDRDASGDIRVDTVLAMKSAERKYLFALYVSLGMWLWYSPYRVPEMGARLMPPYSGMKTRSTANAASWRRAVSAGSEPWMDFWTAATVGKLESHWVGSSADALDVQAQTRARTIAAFRSSSNRARSVRIADPSFPCEKNVFNISVSERPPV